MRNAILSGSIIGIVSVFWIILMQSFGYNPQNLESNENTWIEYSSILIPFIGLYFGIKGFKKEKGGSLNFFEGIFEGFKITAVGGLIAALASFLYIAYFEDQLVFDYMERIFGAIVIGLLATLTNALFLMNTHKMYKK
jgi:hypothetical protein